MDITVSLMWFMFGAALAIALRYLIHLNEQRRVFVSMVSSYIPLIVNFKQHLIIALDKKKEWYKEMGLSDQEIINQTSQEQNFIDSWEIISTAIFINSVPKKYHKYLQSEITKKKGNL